MTDELNMWSREVWKYV